MAYNIKDVFYLDTSATITKATAGDGTAQLDLSAYIDPIARGRTKGTGLAIYKVHWNVWDADNSGEPWDDAETGTTSFGLIAGLGAGDNATGAIAATDDMFQLSNNLLISAGSWYGPASMAGNPSTPVTNTDLNQYVNPSTEVPYVVVRDNVCLVYATGANFIDTYIISCRLECAQISLDQATLNQLLRTQTV